ncbi:heme/hemin ABC transporter substrate-binding protein [Reinekea blandensis]|uniref:Hemin ABC transporter, periplasmic hemin-binding protein n=1 Tax=Reinekea blandensis MED297 TaxID=314283 RepID=A4BG01_9GAMM|nr:ABC transporter substrate-binding protein [Reinekea blandensis]EAR09019.1 hemin ABC transporter, periplasmic hemin-binding protein [Reinekea sp. MED297] [Reinekea blandensis MED297]
MKSISGLTLTSLLSLSLSLPVLAEPTDTSRIASVDANATEILMGFGLADALVAVDVTSQSLVGERGLPDLGYHRALSAEGVLSTEPTLVIGSTHMGPAPVVETLTRTGVSLVQLPAASNAEELIVNIADLGEQLSRTSEAAEMVAQVRRELSAIQETAGDAKPRMVFLLNMSTRGLSQAGSGTTGDALIQLLGGDNITQYGGYKTVSMEALLELDPDVILVGSESSQADAAADLVSQHPLLEHARAYQNQRILTVDAGKMVAGVSLGVVREAHRLSQLVY